jgi:TonB family protein
MSRILILLSAFLIWSTGSHAFAQDKKQSGVATTQVTTETERPKTEVDRLIEKAKERGEVVLARCLQDCGENVIDGDVEAGRALELPKPPYPALARAAHVSGQVTVQLIIDIDGTVMEAAAVSGHPLLYGVSVEAARRSRFSPTKIDGKPVKVTGAITYNFVSQ